MDPENEAPPTVEHPFEARGEWWDLCKHCGLAMPAHLSVAEEPEERISHAEGAFARAFKAEMEGAQEQEEQELRRKIRLLAYNYYTISIDNRVALRAAAQEALELLDLLVAYGRPLPDYNAAAAVRERLRAALAATS